MLQPSRTEGNEDILESPTFDLDFYGLLAIKKVIVGSMVCDPDLGTKDLDCFFFFSDSDFVRLLVWCVHVCLVSETLASISFII